MEDFYFNYAIIRMNLLKLVRSSEIYTRLGEHEERSVIEFTANEILPVPKENSPDGLMQ